jgi:putative ABC transport system permease protein
MRLLTLCFRNLFRRKMRTSLCIVGVVLATTFVIAVGATTMRYTTVIKEMNVLFSGQVMVVSKDTIVIQAIPIGGGMLPQTYTIEKMQNLTGVEKTVPILLITPTMNIGGTLLPVPENFSMGIPVDDWQLILGPTPLRGAMGHFPTNESSNEVVVGASLADQYGWVVGTKIMFNGYELEVVGILDTRLALLNRCVVMPLKLAQEIYNYPDSVNIITAKPLQGNTQKSLAVAVENKISYANALTEDERNDMIQPILAQVETWNLGIQTVVFIMSLILVMTVTLMSVAERRRDFATLDAIGAPLNHVFRLVILETALIGVVGGAFGIFFGSMTTLVLASLYTNIPLAQFFPSIFEIVPPLYMFEIFTTIVVVCCVGGLIPAMNAARTRIAEVLRAEY